MKTLEDFNAERREHYIRKETMFYNGIICPDCGVELIDTDPYMTLTSNPPQKSIGCINCDYKGYRIA